VDAALRLNMKRNEMRMKELETRFGITKHAMNQVRDGLCGCLRRP
jgi:hypothetical protein